MERIAEKLRFSQDFPDKSGFVTVIPNHFLY